MTTHLQPVNRQAALMVSKPVELTEVEKLNLERDSIICRIDQLIEMPKNINKTNRGREIEKLKRRLIEIKSKIKQFDESTVERILINNLKDHVGEYTFKRILETSKAQSLRMREGIK